MGRTKSWTLKFGEFNFFFDWVGEFSDDTILFANI
jgi:hypothetical protein